MQSLINKRRELKVYLDQNEIHILFLTEAWITEKHSPSEYQIKGYQSPAIHFKEKGGTMIYVKNGIPFNEIQMPNKSEDSTWVVIRTGNKKERLYGCVYRSPNSPKANDSNLIENLKWACTRYKEVVVTGDFNLPGIDWCHEEASRPFEREFLTLIQELNLEQLVTEETRFRHGQNASLLDLILTSNPDFVQNIEYLPPLGKSDHVVVKFSVANGYVRTKRAQRTQYRRINEEAFNTILDAQNWNEMFNHRHEIGEAFEQFRNVIVNGIEENSPKIRETEHPKAPWSTRKIERLSRNKRKKWDEYKFNRTAERYEEYKKSLNTFTAEKTKAVRNYETRLTDNKNANPKAYHCYLSRKNKYANNQVSLKGSNQKVTSDTETCVEILRKNFDSVFTRGKSHNVNLGEPRINVKMPELKITRERVLKELKNIDTSKASGPDAIPGFILKKFADKLSYPLTLLYQRMYEEGDIPKILKSANITPSHKGGDKTDPGNYRPISLTPVITKIFEIIYAEVLVEHLNDQNILSDKQHGFRKHRSTNTNLIDFWEDITKIADEGKPITVIYTDLRKAFDSVPHDLLIKKLEYYGVDGKNLRWLENYLTDRTQRVQINGIKSRTSEVESGVPQGGVLSGVLFSIYINDLPDVIKKCKVALYADDAKIYSSVESDADSDLIQKDNDSIVEWCRLWRLNMNVRKCLYIHYVPINSKKNDIPNYKMEDIELDRKKQAKDLGVIISDNLKFHEHVNQICSKTRGEIGRVRRSFVSRSPQFLRNLFKTYVRPHLEHCANVWNPMNQTDIQKIEKTQNAFTRLLKHGNVMTPEQRNAYLNITTHEERRNRGDLITTYKNIHNAKLFKLRTRDGARGNSKHIEKQYCRTNLRQHSFTQRVVDRWNNLPEEVVNAESLTQFKIEMERHQVKLK